MYDETKFNELKELVDNNADLMFEIDTANDTINELDSAYNQDGEYIKTRGEVHQMCKAATEKADFKEVRTLSAYCKHYYEIVKYIADNFEYYPRIKEIADDNLSELKENQNKIQQILAEDIFD